MFSEHRNECDENHSGGGGDRRGSSGEARAAEVVFRNGISNDDENQRAFVGGIDVRLVNIGEGNRAFIDHDNDDMLEAFADYDRAFIDDQAALDFQMDFNFRAG